MIRTAADANPRAVRKDKFNCCDQHTNYHICILLIPLKTLETMSLICGACNEAITNISLDAFGMLLCNIFVEVTV